MDEKLFLERNEEKFQERKKKKECLNVMEKMKWKAHRNDWNLIRNMLIVE